MEDIQIRTAIPDDTADIHKMVCALSAFHGDTATITQDQLAEAIFGPGSIAFVAVQDRIMVGYAGINRTISLHTGQPRFDIHHLFVATNMRTRGVGKRLIAAACDHAASAGATGVTIGTIPANTSAQAAYRGMGLQEITDAGPRFWIPANQ